MMDWAEKYRPQHLQDIVGNTTAIREISDWARSWTKESKPLILYGKPGIGKTTAAYALANDMHWEVVEMNASDQRTKAIIEKIAGSSSTTASLTGAKRKLIILDEADNLHGSADRGGARAIIDLIKHSRQPILLIANDIYGIPKELKKLCEPVQFRALQARSVVPRLRHICAAEQIRCDSTVLATIAESSSGDMRAAINMLCAAGIGSPVLEDRDVATSQKDERSTVFDLISGIFKGKPDAELMKLSREVSDTPDTVEQWIGANLGNIEDLCARAEAYRCLARADEFIGLTYRRQYYMLWRYANALMLIGTASAAGGAGLKGRISPPSHWQSMARSRRQKMIRTSVLNKLSSRMHIPQTTLREDFLTPISLMVDDNPEYFVEYLDLDQDELNFFLHDKERAKSIIKGIAKKKKDAEKQNPAKMKVDDDPVKEEQEKEKPAPPRENQATLFDGF
jgi:replication factor C large subunit